jgi:hypothetical protein
MLSFRATRPRPSLVNFSFNGDGPNITNMADFAEQNFLSKAFDGLVVRVTMALNARADADVWLLAETSGMRKESQDQGLILEHRTAWTPANPGPSWYSRLPPTGASSGFVARVQTRLVVPAHGVTRLRCATAAAGEWFIEGQVMVLRGKWCEPLEVPDAGEPDAGEPDPADLVQPIDDDTIEGLFGPAEGEA